MNSCQLYRQEALQLFGHLSIIVVGGDVTRSLA